jgi:pimeloyl-ACP methyl ester carboxylesterase
MSHLLAYSIEGIGNPIVFIHGFCETKEIWTYFKKYFHPNFQTVCVDLPGFGDSPILEKECSIPAMARCLKKTIDNLHLEKIVLVGHSLGGYVALSYAELFPEKVAGICLFHSTAFEDTPEKKENRNKTIEYVKKHGVEAFCNPFVPGLFFHKRRALLKNDIEKVLQIAKKTQLSVVVDTTLAMRDRKDQTTLLQNMKIPVGFIVGKEDTAVPLERSLAQCHLADESHVLFLAETGHMGMFEREKECALFLRGICEGIFR